MSTRILAGAAAVGALPQRSIRGIQAWCLVLDSLGPGYQRDVDERNEQLGDAVAIAFQR